MRCGSAKGICADSGRMYADNVQEVRRECGAAGTVFV